MLELKMCTTFLSVIILCFCLQNALQFKIANVNSKDTDTDFDTIVLSQEWPLTECIFYKYISNPGGRCILPKEKNRWTIHGIWPRKMGKYPEYCNESWAFDPEKIKPIETELMQAEIQVFKEDQPYTFWSWEWRKHGTCAASFEPFNTQLKYFTKSIEWNLKYSVSDMLEAANIFPSDTKFLEPEDIANAVKAKTKKDPMVGCFLMDKVSYLQEVRICLDKQFNVIDCQCHVIDIYCYSYKGFIYPANE